MTQIDAAQSLAVPTIELHTGEFAHAVAAQQDYQIHLDRLISATGHAVSANIRVAAGHGLTQDSTPLLRDIPGLDELNIGHALVSDAVFVGLDASVRAYKAACN